MKSTRILVAIVVLQGLTLLSLWTGSGPVTPAYGQIPDAGAQRAQVVEELKSLNGKMDKLIELLAGGQLQVNAVPAEPKNQKDAGK